MQHTTRSGLLLHLHKLRDDLERVSDPQRHRFGNGGGLFAIGALRKGRDTTHFDGQANDSLEERRYPIAPSTYIKGISRTITERLIPSHQSQ